ncbi:SDR family NAD-dependent epimerase/dehydratase, partial [Streptomyces sp. AD55]
GTVTVAGAGDRTHPLCYVDDMADGVLRVAAGRSVRPVGIGGDEHPTTLEIARRLADPAGHGAPPVFGGRAADGPAAPAPVTGFAREISAGGPACPGRSGWPAPWPPPAPPHPPGIPVPALRATPAP